MSASWHVTLTPHARLAQLAYLLTLLTNLLAYTRRHAQLGAQATRLHAILDREASLLGGDRSRIVLGKVAQGSSSVYSQSVGGLGLLQQGVLGKVAQGSSSVYSQSVGGLGLPQQDRAW